MAGSADRSPTDPSPTLRRWSGAVLCGGASRRMGRDKALIVVDGRPLARRVADALRDAGADEVVAVGGDEASLSGAGLDVVADRWPGEGPLGGVVTALLWAGGGGVAHRTADEVAGAVAVVACDLVEPSASALRTTVEALAARPGADVAVPLVGGRRQWAHAAWRTRAAAALDAQFTGGERAIHAAVSSARLTVVDVTGLDQQVLADADTPGDLPAPDQ